jgi:hypothetical protein
VPAVHGDMGCCRVRSTADAHNAVLSLLLRAGEVFIFMVDKHMAPLHL